MYVFGHLNNQMYAFFITHYITMCVWVRVSVGVYIYAGYLFPQNLDDCTLKFNECDHTESLFPKVSWLQSNDFGFIFVTPERKDMMLTLSHQVHVQNRDIFPELGSSCLSG